MTVITLVHGTYAKNAAWTHDSSPLVAALRASIHGEVRIEALNWSGHNLHISRCRAANHLRAHVKLLAEQYPDSKQFIVAHSHGGNVAMYALTDPQVHGLVGGVVSLSTPFILCRSRSLWEQTAILLLAVVGFLLALHTESYSPNWLNWRFWFLGCGLVVLGLAWCFLAAISRRLLGHWKGTPSEIHQRLADSFVLPAMSSHELLIVRAPGDEASAALGASTFGLWLFGRISDLTAKVFDFGSWLQTIEENWATSRKAIWSAAYLLTGAVVTYGAVHFDVDNLGHHAGSWFLAVGIGLILIAIAFWMPNQYNGMSLGFDMWGIGLQLVYAVLAVPCLLMCALFSTAFGHDVALLASMFEFSVESSPIGNFSVLSLSSRTAGGLWHSLPYSDNEAFVAIVDWINQIREESIPGP